MGNDWLSNFQNVYEQHKKNYRWIFDGGQWFYDGQRRHVYNMEEFYKFDLDEYGLCSPIDFSDDSVLLKGIRLSEKWLQTWHRLGGHKKGKCRRIEVMVWVLDINYDVPVPFPIASNPGLDLWDLSSRIALHTYLNYFDPGTEGEKIGIKDFWIQESHSMLHTAQDEQNLYWKLRNKLDELQLY